jgi:hypothetical protein
VHVDVEHPPHLGGVHVPDVRHLVARDAGVVDHDVQRAEPRRRRVHGAAHLLLDRDVAVDEHDALAVASEGVAQLLAGVVLDVRDADLGGVRSSAPRRQRRPPLHRNRSRCSRVRISQAIKPGQATGEPAIDLAQLAVQQRVTRTGRRSASPSLLKTRGADRQTGASYRQGNSSQQSSMRQRSHGSWSRARTASRRRRAWSPDRSASSWKEPRAWVEGKGTISHVAHGPVLKFSRAPARASRVCPVSSRGRCCCGFLS